ncbi:AbrB/MazE/SpoVT family DNA-binding domain-containing protein [Halorussus salilacus]|uniref:AbrB/MazE/SpoVT family DNA-binding domain-containing protein n=1 Tax=Halorussus salilacus TaxID=2953750 RepID=UPI00209FA387|nr:AbrB/MazE/SpoVT family DNA-binding domain-containing protein [Halorussus salilacus]USZ66866.1 AbrB/MazE/SpoVT family DNA-binding domain-containing protein [Halorussus salilacus]
MRSKTDGGAVVRVSKKGQTTIPKFLREKFDIDAPGRVRFRETNDGEIVVEPVPHPTDLRGSLADETDESGAVWSELDRLRAREKEGERNDLDALVDEDR